MLQNIPGRMALLVDRIKNARNLVTRPAMLMYRVEDTEKKENEGTKINNEQKSRTTVDKSEIDHHAGQKHQWWFTNGSMKGLHALNKLRVPLVRDGLLSTNSSLEIFQHTPTPLQGAKILEVGCGGGIYAEPLSRLGASVTGVDASEQLIALAKEHAEESRLKNLQYHHDTIESFSAQHEQEFDAVVASEVLEHVSHKDLFVESCTRALKPGGSLFLTTMNKTMAAWLGGILIAENLLNILPQGTHHWDKFISPGELVRILEKHDCKTKMIHGMFYLFVNNEWYWCSNTSINYAIHAVKKMK